jgi:hypothetical protein
MHRVPTRGDGQGPHGPPKTHPHAPVRCRKRGEDGKPSLGAAAPESAKDQDGHKQLHPHRPPRATNYSRGRALEYLLKLHIQNYGYTVTRAAGSHGHYDLIAGRGHQTWAIQLKKRKPTLQEMKDITKASMVWHVSHLMTWKEPRGPWNWSRFLNGETELGVPDFFENAPKP